MEDDFKNEIQNSRFGRIVESHLIEIYPKVYSRLSNDEILYQSLSFYAVYFEQKYKKYLANYDEQFAFNEAFDEVICLMQTEGENEDLLKNQLSMFDLDKNNFINSELLN